MNHTALLLIDFQKGFDEPFWGTRNNPSAEYNASEVLACWRHRGMNVVHVQHCSTEMHSPLRPDQSGWHFKDEVQPKKGEHIFSKKVNSAFIGTTLERFLRGRELNNLFIAGLTTDHCVSTTTRMAGNLGFNVTVLSDATATFDRKSFDGKHYTAEEIHHIHLASLHGEFCRVADCTQVIKMLRNLSGTSDHKDS